MRRDKIEEALIVLTAELHEKSLVGANAQNVQDMRRIVHRIGVLMDECADIAPRLSLAC
jgi:hypothetical protein